MEVGAEAPSATGFDSAASPATHQVTDDYDDEGEALREPGMANPTVVVLTDRDSLDDLLFGTFTRCSDVLR